MSEIVIDYSTLSLSQQVLERQHTHARAISTYLAANADISDATGLLLSAFDPLSRSAVSMAEQAMTALSGLETSLATAVGDTAIDVADNDGQVGTQHTPPYHDLGGPTLPPAGDSAPSDYGSVDSYFWEKGISTGESIGGGIDDARALIDDVGQWGTPSTVTERVDASSFLVPPSAPENFVQDLRWSAGLLLGSIDWVAEKFLGYSVLQRCVYEPLAGDWQGIYRASQAWSHGADALMGISRNHAGLVASTPATWQGLSGASFRGAMTSATGATMGMSAAFEYAAGLVKTISTVCKLACAGIGSALNVIANVLIKKAAEAAVPVVGWAVGAATAYTDINKAVRMVRRIYSLLEMVSTAIADFAEGKTSIMEKLAVLEDLAQGMAANAGATA
ncbi:hypothetical protein [Nocardioides sp.]|uniref:hypothetical protein n=1 Tax=Nocardioides sp. TaxID=35761 RepID=UPI002734596B|nr:hypothetical protein [Nocardioides sp.]MDP3890968.1 hypothetical protein [Nocardioides sp.]